jgi:hypothetical protein
MKNKWRIIPSANTPKTITVPDFLIMNSHKRQLQGTNFGAKKPPSLLERSEKFRLMPTTIVIITALTAVQMRSLEKSSPGKLPNLTTTKRLPSWGFAARMDFLPDFPSLVLRKKFARKECGHGSCPSGSLGLCY